MKETIIKWLNANAVELRQAVIGLLVVNLVLLGLSAISGGLLWFFLHIVNILIADVCLVVPVVYGIKLVKEIN